MNKVNDGVERRKETTETRVPVTPFLSFGLNDVYFVTGTNVGVSDVSNQHHMVPACR